MMRVGADAHDNHLLCYCIPPYLHTYILGMTQHSFLRLSYGGAANEGQKRTAIIINYKKMKIKFGKENTKTSESFLE